MNWIRTPSVAGRFYPLKSDKLNSMLQGFDLKPDEAREKVFAIVAPHAGYQYSGRFAAEVYRRLYVPETVILLCPNHTGKGKRISVWSEGVWKTPLGEVAIDSQIAKECIQHFGEVSGDRDAHLFEHAIEVHLPFLQTLRKDFKLVPIVLAHLNYRDCERVGRALSEVMKKHGPDKILFIASSDMSHFISADEASHDDKLALDKVESMDPVGLYETVTKNQISMCGYIPTTCVMVAAKENGCQHAEIVAYGNSGETTGDMSSVVGYASVRISLPRQS